jgi:uncharacterized protein GlcG (DUF336 family)
MQKVTLAKSMLTSSGVRRGAIITACGKCDLPVLDQEFDAHDDNGKGAKNRWRWDHEGEGNRPADEYLTAFARMDGAWLGSIDIAVNKAFTAKAFDISTLELGRNSQPGDQFFGIHVSNHARVMIFAGGIPIKMNGQIVGAVGVSGGSGEQDQAVAEAVVAAWS